MAQLRLPLVIGTASLAGYFYTKQRIDAIIIQSNKNYIETEIKHCVNVIENHPTDSVVTEIYNNKLNNLEDQLLKCDDWYNQMLLDRLVTSPELITSKD